MSIDPEEQEVERKAGRAMALIIVVTIIVILLFWLIGFDALRDAVS